MKIRQRLALRFTLVSAALTGAILIFIYILTRGFVHADFVERLTQHSRLEILHFASPDVKEFMPSSTFLLVNPVTSIYNQEGVLLHKHGEYEIAETWIELLQNGNVFNVEQGEYTTVGLKYDIDGKDYLVFVSDKDLPAQHELDILIKAISFGWIVSILLSYVAGLYFSANALRPVKHVVKEVTRINKDNLSYRLHTTGKAESIDEIDELIITFNALLTRIESAFIIQKRFVQNASHELKTPLTAIMAEAELALTKDRPLEEYKRTLDVILLETERLVRITQALLTLARTEEGTVHSEMEKINILELLEQTLNTFRLHHPEKVVDGQFEKANVLVSGNAPLLQTAILNILDNAGKYSKSKIVVSASADVHSVDIRITDFGIGIPEHELNKIKAPLFRASNVAEIQGAGLGLSLVDRIARVHGGSLDLTSKVNEGTSCVLTIPRDLRS
ncbi:MAG TPA: HAMP domain-containing sensor histidine kinase [Chryseosolibacter sp.]|nr:HAMP domain-containing sensor histidine kinase [Chryseosolibacter sp.]